MQDTRYQEDIEFILAKRYDNGGDCWASADGRLSVGNPCSTLGCVLMLSELGADFSHPVLRGAVELIFSAWREDGRFRLAPKGAIYPCQTAAAVRVLCELGYAQDQRVEQTLRHLLDIQHHDGGWRCRKFPYGRGPETEYSNPWPTLTAAAAFRHTPLCSSDERLDRAAEFLLSHWDIRTPLGPCHYGIGTRFMKISFPLDSYNLFSYVYVLSFYDIAKSDRRFLEALKVLQGKLAGGKVVVELPNRRLAGLSFCRRGEVSELASQRYNEILENLK